MPLRYLIDENLRGPFWTAMVQANDAWFTSHDPVRAGTHPWKCRASWLMAKGCPFSLIVPCRLAGHGGTIDLSRRSACAVSVMESSCNRFPRRYDWEFHGHGCWRSSVGRATVL